MKILFIYPENTNLGVSYLSAVLKENGHDAKLIFDPRLFNTYFANNKFLSNVFDFSKNIKKEVQDYKPDLICFSIFSDYFSWAKKIATLIKTFTDTPILAGGIHPTLVPKEVMKHRCFDYVCVSEGEETLPKLCNKLKAKEDISEIKNLWSRKEGKPYFAGYRKLITDLDSLPFPDKDIFNNEYKDFANTAYTIISARGCPNACTYCYNGALRIILKDLGPYLRKRSVANVIAELKYAKEKYNIQKVSFFDDLFIYDKKWLKEFSTAYKKEINLPYFCHVGPKYVNEETVKLLKESGCTTVTMGIQSVDQNLRKNVLNRTETNEQIISAIKLLKENNIFTYTNIIIGLPLENKETLHQTAIFCSRYKSDAVTTSWLRYYPKSPITKLAIGNNMLTNKEIKEIEESATYTPYSQNGNTFDKTKSSLRNLIQLSGILPEKYIKFLIKKERYIYIPSFSLRFFIPVLKIIFLNTKGRKPFVSITMADVAKFYLHFIIKHLKLTFLKKG